MEKKSLGKTGLKISRLGLGTVKFGRNEGVKYPQGFEIPDEKTLADLLTLAKSLGINTLDTAPAYGSSEERLGQLLSGQRKDWVIIGKAGEDFEDGQSIYNFTSDHFKYSLERSLKRLDTNYIDALLIHSDGRDVEILSDASLIKTLHDFKAQGLVKAIGASTKTVAGGRMACDLLDIVMCTYNPSYTDEKAVLDYALEKETGVIIKKALASGHATSAAKSLKFVSDHQAVDSIIVGTITPDHLKANAAVFSSQSA